MTPVTKRASWEAPLAVAMDAVAGEPRRCHPVRGMGRVLEAAEARWNPGSRGSAETSRGRGVGLVIAGCAVFAGLGWAAERASKRLGPPGTVARALLLSTTLSPRALGAAAAGIRAELESGSLERARKRLARDLVARPTDGLGPSEVASAVIESLAENFADAVVAPLFWHRVGGLPAAAVYRFVNTADAMLGYRTAELEAFGWAAARGDDEANRLPSRLAAGLLAMAAAAVSGNGRAAIRAAARDGRRTASPNAGWPMAALGGALGVRLEKIDSYVLNRHGRRPDPADIRRAEAVVKAATGAAALLVPALPTRVEGPS